MRTVDYIVVGQGLAGTILAYTFLKNGKKIFVIDEKNLSSSSKIAAGNYNPIVFKRLVKSWKADETIPFTDNFYMECEQFLNAEFFWKKEIAKIFSDERERNFWKKKSKEDNRYLSEIDDSPSLMERGLGGEAGFGIVKNAGKIYSAKFLEEFRNCFLEQNVLMEEQFDFAQLKIQNDFAEYKNIKSKKIIFCDGWKAMENPYFNYLPFKPAKGEILILKIEDFHTDKIIHKNGYLYQIGENLFVAGSTYEWNELNDFPSEKGKNEIIEKLGKIIKAPYEIVGHYAGVRPSTKDRRPFIGLHPKHKSLGIFNGFGTKAVMLAPYFANEIFQFLEGKKTLDSEIDIKRFQ